MYYRVATEIDLMSHNNISHIFSSLCFIAKGTRFNAVKMSSLKQNVVIYQKNQDIA